MLFADSGICSLIIPMGLFALMVWKIQQFLCRAPPEIKGAVTDGIIGKINKWNK